jgi:hypothetical protein
MKILVAGNKNYGLSSSIAEVYPESTFLSRSSGYDLLDSDVQLEVAKMSLDYDVFLSVSCLHGFNQVELVRKIADQWIKSNHTGYLIGIGSSADTPVKGNSKIYPVEKRALRAYLRQLSQICGSEQPGNFKITYLSPGNLHTPSMDRRMPSTPKIDCNYVAEVISWLINQPKNINISELCLDRIQKT